MPSSSSMQPRKHALRLTTKSKPSHFNQKLHYATDATTQRTTEGKKLWIPKIDKCISVCLLIFLRTMKSKQIEYFETWFLPEPGSQ